MPTGTAQQEKKTGALTIKAAKEVIETVLKTNIVPFLWGAPGIGKSTLIADICKDKGWELRDFRLTLVSPVDLRGIPYVDKEKGKSIWFPPEFLPSANDKSHGILFLDEVNLATPAVQAAAYQLILDRKLGEYTLPEGWKVVAAGNRAEDKASVYRLSAPLANRFVHLELDPDLDSWMTWARERDIAPTIILYLEKKPEHFYKAPVDNEIKGFPTPRSWDFASQLLTAFEYKGHPIPALKHALIGALGFGVAGDFLGFIQNPDIEKTSRIVQDFIAGKSVTLPLMSETSLRMTVRAAIGKKFARGEITKDKFEEFKKKHLTPEEASQLEQFVNELKEEVEE